MIFKQNIKTSTCRCSTTNKALTTCPTCDNTGLKVTLTTLKSQLKKENLNTIISSVDDFNFCKNPQCDTVYYSNDNTEVFGQLDIRSKVTVKNNDPKTPLCYCRKLLKKDILEMIEKKEPNIVMKIKAILADGKSFCEKSNPKGVCCTDDIKSFLLEHGVEWNKPNKSFFSATSPSGCC